MPGYKPQVKSENGDMVDIPIAATYDENGNKFNEQYVSIAAQTFTEEQKAQARANIGAASGSKKYMHNVLMRVSDGRSSSNSTAIIAFSAILDVSTKITASNIYSLLGHESLYPCTGGVYDGQGINLGPAACIYFHTSNYFQVWSGRYGDYTHVFARPGNIETIHDSVKEI